MLHFARFPPTLLPPTTIKFLIDLFLWLSLIYKIHPAGPLSSLSGPKIQKATPSPTQLCLLYMIPPAKLSLHSLFSAQGSPLQPWWHQLLGSRYESSRFGYPEAVLDKYIERRIARTTSGCYGFQAQYPVNGLVDSACDQACGKGMKIFRHPSGIDTGSILLR